MIDVKPDPIALLKRFLSAQLTDRQPQLAASYLTKDVTWLGITDSRDVHNREEALAYFIREADINPNGYPLQYLEEHVAQLAQSCHSITIRFIVLRDEVPARCVVSAVTKPENGEEKIASLHFSILRFSYKFPLSRMVNSSLRSLIIRFIFYSSM